MTIPVALTIAGSDPSGGAGLQADLKTFHQHRVYGASVVTLLTVQNTQAVDEVRLLESSFVLAQLETVLDDIPPNAAKTGALGSAEVVEAVARRVATVSFPVVVDPVMISTHGARLIDQDAEQALATRLLPSAYLTTPNLREAAALSARQVNDPPSMEDAARRISDLGARHVLVKGGHLEGRAVDILLADGQVHRFESDHVDTRHTHGTGCVYSAAITARLALGDDIVTAVGRAKVFIASAIATNPGLGGGYGPTNMMASVD